MRVQEGCSLLPAADEHCSNCDDIVSPAAQHLCIDDHPAALPPSQVYCEIVNKARGVVGHFSSSISCLDPRPAAHITHSTDSSHSSSSSLPSEAAYTTISCERYLADKYGVQLQLPGCPCIVVELSEDAQQGSSSDQQQYRTYPLECCW
jgi:hypothetical protein